jgi:hypothetical protein
VWAVGSNLTGAGTQRTLVDHWNGTRWPVVASPNTGSGANTLAAIAAVNSGGRATLTEFHC